MYFVYFSVVANGDVLNPAMRLLIHQRMLGQFDRILELITEKMGLRVLGGVRRYSLKKCSLHIWTVFFPLRYDIMYVVTC